MSLAPESEETKVRSTLAKAILLCCVTAIAYLPTLRSGFIWDDDTLVTNNALVHAASGLRKFWFSTQPADYWPVTMTAFWVQWRLWGMDALGYHVANVALHIGECLLLWAVLRRMGIRAAYLAAFLFAVHPVNAETVAWISELKNLMAMLFFLLSIWFFLGFEAGGATRPCAAGLGLSQTRRRGEASPHLLGRLQAGTPALLLSFLCFILAMLSKGSVAILPLVLLGIIRWRRPIQRRDLLTLTPFFAVGAILAAVDVWFQRHGAAEVIRSAGFLERLLGAGAVIWFYLGKALWPARLIFVYPAWHIQTARPLWWIPLLAAVGFTVALWKCHRSWCRPVLFAWGFFCVSLLPVMGFTDVYFMTYSLVADHYQHIALIGVATLVATEISEFGIRNPRVGFRFPLSASRFGQIAATAAICLLAALTYRQCENYRDSKTLYLATLEKNPDAWIAHTNLGIILAAEGRFSEATDHYRTALALKPDLADAAIDLGIALSETGRSADGIAFLERAVQLDPKSVGAHYNLGLALVTARRYPEAIIQFESVKRLNPDYVLTDFNLAGALAALGRYQEAVPYYERALSLRPEFPEAHDDLGEALVQLGRLPEAADEFATASRLLPGDAAIHNNLGCALAQLGRNAEARRQFEAALAIKPDDAEVKANLNRLGAGQPGP